MPVIPVAVVGTDIVAPPGKKFGRWTRPLVRFGKPLDFSRYEGLEGDRFILRSAADEIMYEIMRLSGQEYVDMYASRAKALDKEAAREAAKEAAKQESRQAAESGTPDAAAPERRVPLRASLATPRAPRSRCAPRCSASWRCSAWWCSSTRCTSTASASTGWRGPTSPGSGSSAMAVWTLAAGAF